MYGDFSRRIGEQHKHYSRLLQQQGRLPLDADFNELGESILRYLQQFVIDAIGPYGTAVGSNGFKITFEGHALKVGAGFYYLSGMRCDSTGKTAARDQDPVPRGNALEYVLRSNVPFVLQEPPPDLAYLVVLRAWERTVTAAQDPGLSDAAFQAFGDTVVRSQLVWQVLALTVLPEEAAITIEEEDETKEEKEEDDFRDEGDELRKMRRKGRPALLAWKRYERQVTRGAKLSRGQLCAEVVPESAPYVRNELHRVEVHAGGSMEDCSFKHSRDNGSTLFAFEVLAAPSSELLEVRLSGTSDALSGLKCGLWLEYIDDMCRPPGQAPMYEITVVSSREGVVTIRGSGLPSGNADLHPRLRQWDHHRRGDRLEWSRTEEIGHAGQQKEQFTATMRLGNLLIVTVRSGEQPFHSGDSWTILMRSSIGGPVWRDDGAGQAGFEDPERFNYHEAPLALLSKKNDIVDLRSTFYGSAIWEPRSD